MMKARSALFGAAVAATALLAVGSAKANYLVTFDSSGGSVGAYTYTYNVSLDNFQRVDPGPVGNTMLNSFFSLHDFGPVTGITDTGILASDYAFTTPFVSPHAYLQAAPDSASIENIQAFYNGSTTIAPLTFLGTFTVTSTLAPVFTTIVYEAQAIKDNNGTPAGNSTSTVAPIAVVPEPVSMALLGSGLVGLGLIRRKRG